MSALNVLRKIRPAGRQPWDEKSDVLRPPTPQLGPIASQNPYDSLQNPDSLPPANDARFSRDVLNPAIQPVSQIPVADSLPPVGFNTPDSGYENATRFSRDVQPIERPRLANPVTPDSPVGHLADTYRNQPLDTSTDVPDTTPTLRPIKPLETTPGILGDTINPVSAPTLNAGAFRDRLTKPVDPYQRAAENYNASMTAPADRGQDSQGNQRTHGREGVLGRIESGLKGVLDDYSHGGNLVSSLIRGGRSAANTNLNSDIRLERRQAQNAQQYGQQIQLKGEQEKIAQQQANTDWLRQRPDNEAIRLGQGQQRIEQGGQRIEQGNRRLSQQDVNAERQGVLASLKTHPTLDATRDAELIARARKAGIEVDPENYGKQSRGVWIEGVYSDPYTGSPILRDGQQIVDRTKIPVEYDGYTVTPGTAVNATAAANRQATGIAASDARATRSEARQDARTTTSEDRTAARQEEADRRTATTLLSQAKTKREQAYRANISDEQRTQLLSDADDLERTAAGYSAVVEVQTPSAADLAGNPFAKPTYRIKPKGQSTPQSTAPTGRALQRVDSSSMDNQVKTHFDKGGKAIKVRDVKTGKETLVDNYNDYLVAIGRK